MNLSKIRTYILIKYKFIRFKNIFSQLNEIINIYFFLINSKKKVSFFYDFKTSPISIGDFVQVCIFLKFFYLKKKKIDFYYVKEKNTYFQNNLKKSSFTKLILDQISISKKIFKNSIKIKEINFNQHVINNIRKKSYVVFYKDVLKRKNFIQKIFLLLNFFLYFQSNNFINKFLFNKNDFSSNNKKIIKFINKKKFISIIFRRNLEIKVSKYRNTNLKRLNYLLKIILKKYKEKNILFVSDKKGINYLKNYLSRNFSENNFFYSQDFSKNLIDNANLLLNSCIVLALKEHGGISQFIVYSQVPFLLENYPKEKFKDFYVFKYNLFNNYFKLHPWHNDYQQYIRKDYLKFIKKLNNDKVFK